MLDCIGRNRKKYDKLDAKGIETVRRDNCGLTRQVVSTCLNKILVHGDVEGAIKYTKRTISNLLMNKIDISQLIISKSLVKVQIQMITKQEWHMLNWHVN